MWFLQKETCSENFIKEIYDCIRLHNIIIRVWFFFCIKIGQCVFFFFNYMYHFLSYLLTYLKYLLYI